MSVPTVLMATFSGLPQGEPGHHVLDAALQERGIRGVWACWDDPDVDWSAGDLVAVRSTWDYTERREEFLLWARRVEQAGAPLLNGVEVFDEYTDKAYLVTLAETIPDLPVIPTRRVDDPAGILAAQDEFGDVVVKGRVGAGGEDVFLVLRGEDPAGVPVRYPAVAQPLAESVRTAGELSVFVLDGKVIATARKVPAPGEIRVHEHLGGMSLSVPTEQEPADVALSAVAAVGASDVDYARVDLLHWDGHWRINEIELVEPSLYLDVLPENGPAFADLVAARLAASPAPD